jgi:hypothetical protein
MYAYKINDNGYIINNYVVGGDTIVPEDCITVQLPQPMTFQRTKWNGNEWVEGETEEEKTERENQQLLNSLKPSIDEVKHAILEIEIITIVTEMGTAQ